MTRIVAGELGGRRLDVPPGKGTRPTSDRAREGLFSTLDALDVLEGARVIDLYAGSGAVGLEALSRGAAEALFVEADRAAAAVVRRNAVTLGVGERATVTQQRVELLAAQPCQGAPYDVVFADPPYVLDTAELTTVLSGLESNGWLAPGAVVVVERSSRDPEWVWATPLRAERVRRYGEASLWYGRRP